MRLPGHPDVHLTYCLNVHPGETWEENFAAIRDKALAVKRIVAPNEPFGLGLRLSNVASQQLSDKKKLAEFRAFLADSGLYVFTINGFPYGNFHGKKVKENVYRPDWADPARLTYTNRLADILAVLLPEGVPGSISTVPLTYKAWIRDTQELRQFQMGDILMNVASCVDHLEELHERTGRQVALALEPEPDCFLENTDEVLSTWANFKGMLSGNDDSLDTIRRHVGACLDICHLAVSFEDPKTSIERLTAAGIAVPKVQLSSALRLTPTRTARRKLLEFADPVYLHQVKVRKASGEIVSYADLDQAPEARSADGPPGEEWRVHFHVPLYLGEYGELKSTNALYTPELAKLLTSGVTPHLEIETYTFDVLPAGARESDLVRSIAKEYEWTLAWLGA